MTKELKERLIKFTNDVYYLQDEWADLGWSLSCDDSSLDGDACDDFETKLLELKQEARKIQELI